jgi:Cellulase (glycosyl hydrolase family 5)
MPFIAVNKSTAWENWKRGQMMGLNAYMHLLKAEAGKNTNTINNISVVQGCNLVRLHFGWAEGGYAIYSPDMVAIGQSFASNSGAGWKSTTLTARAQYQMQDPIQPGVTPPTSTYQSYKAVAEMILSILNECSKAGVGVVLVGNYCCETGGRLWQDVPQTKSKYITKFGVSCLNDYFEDFYKQATSAATIRQALIDFWRATASEFGSHPALVGYDILNEPSPEGGVGPVPSNSAWPGLAKELIAAIRSFDPITPIIVAGTQGGFSRGLKVFESDPYWKSNFETQKLVFTFHCYDPAGATANGLPSAATQMGITFPTKTNYIYDDDLVLDYTNFDIWYKQVSKHINSFQSIVKGPVFMGEFSYIDQSGELMVPKDGWLDGRQLVTPEPRYYMTGVDDFTRQVTSIEIDKTNPKKVTLTLGNVKPGTTVNGSQQWGFAITSSNVTTTTDLINDGSIDATGALRPNKKGVIILKHQVAITLEAGRSGLKDEAAAAAADAIVRSLNIKDAEVEISTLGHTITVILPTNAPANADIPATPDPATGGYVPIAVLTYRPTAMNRAQASASRENFINYILRMAQKNGLSWAYHCAADNPEKGGENHWRPTTNMQRILRTACMGRSI